MTYHRGARELQERFDSRRLADRLAERLSRTVFNTDDVAFIQSRPMLFLSTADADGQPDCSYKGGSPGFVRVVGPADLAFPSYDGNGMFRSLGNLLVNARVGILFLDFEQPRRLRVLGSASVHLADAMMELFPGAQAIVRVRVAQVFPNCPRYIPRMRLIESSVYVPRAGYDPPEPAWKLQPAFREVLPRRD